jgi:hypothetical protein
MPLISPTTEKRRSHPMSGVAARLALVAGFLVFAPDVSANVLNNQDVDSIGIVLAKSAGMHQDITNIERISPRSDSPRCFLDLLADLELVQAQLGRIHDETITASLMVDERDEKIALVSLGVAVKYLLADTTHSGNATLAMSRCFTDSTVVVKGQELLHLYDEIKAVVRGIASKIGR